MCVVEEEEEEKEEEEEERKNQGVDGLKKAEEARL